MSESDDTRRTFCKVCIGGMSVCSAAAIGFPVVTFLGFPRLVGADKPVIVQLDQLVAGQVQYENLRGQTIVVLSGADGPMVLNASCTHLGCTVIWDTAALVFRCPCHGAVFSPEGEVISGPVSAPLKKVEFELSDGTLIVT